MADGKRWLFILRHPPYHGFRTQESLDMVLTAAAFDQPASLLLLDDGVFQLKRGQVPTGFPAAAKLFETLAWYDLREVLVERESLAERGLNVTDLAMAVRAIPASGVAALIAAHEVVVTL